jgi:hypothetical protein
MRIVASPRLAEFFGIWAALVPCCPWLSSPIPTFPVGTELGDLQSEPDVLRLRSIPALSQTFRHWGGERA